MNTEKTYSEISEYITDHHAHFGCYPAEVESGGIVYQWHEYWAIIEAKETNTKGA